MQFAVQELRADVAAAAAVQTELNATMSALRLALRATAALAPVRPSAGGGGARAPPAIEATDRDLEMRAAGAVKVSTGSCGTFDLCELSRFADRLTSALGQV